MQFNRENPVKVSFSVPDRPTVRQQMAYFSETTGVVNRAHLERLWFGARSMITEWQCELFEKDIDLDKVDDPRITEIILWAAVQVKTHLNSVTETPKN